MTANNNDITTAQTFLAYLCDIDLPKNEVAVDVIAEDLSRILDDQILRQSFTKAAHLPEEQAGLTVQNTIEDAYLDIAMDKFLNMQFFWSTYSHADLLKEVESIKRLAEKAAVPLKALDSTAQMSNKDVETMFNELISEAYEVERYGGTVPVWTPMF